MYGPPLSYTIAAGLFFFLLPAGCIVNRQPLPSLKKLPDLQHCFQQTQTTAQRQTPFTRPDCSCTNHLLPIAAFMFLPIEISSVMMHGTAFELALHHLIPLLAQQTLIVIFQTSLLQTRGTLSTALLFQPELLIMFDELP